MPDSERPTPSEAEISADLVARIASGDRAAEGEMYSRYARAVIFILRRRGASPDEAEDLCQETFITACLKLRPAGEGDGTEPIRKSQSLASWLQGIALNKLLGERRKTDRRDTWADTDAIEQAIGEIRGPFDDVAADEILALINKAISNLSTERDRDILVSVYLRDEDSSSIQQRLAIGPEQFYRVFYRARQRLAAEITMLLGEGGEAVTDLRDFKAKRHY